MPQPYYETRSQGQGGRTVAYDLAAHLEARQHTEKAIVLCETPSGTLSSVRKHWHRLTRGVQRQRSSTLNADKILRYTHTISHMQFIHFSTKTPAGEPEAQVHFLRPDQLTEVPLDCYTVYVLAEVPAGPQALLLQWLPENALIVDYTAPSGFSRLKLRPKRQLERQVLANWSAMTAFFESQDIDIARIANHDLTAQEDALDTLLGVYNQFLRLAAQLQRSIDLAQPVTFDHAKKRQFELCGVMAYRVHTLTTTGRASEEPLSFLDDHSFFLHDPAAETILPLEQLVQEVRRHHQAGRERLALALQHKHRLGLLGVR